MSSFLPSKKRRGLGARLRSLGSRFRLGRGRPIGAPEGGYRDATNRPASPPTASERRLFLPDIREAEPTEPPSRPEPVQHHLHEPQEPGEDGSVEGVFVPKGKVVIGFSDGSMVALQDSDPLTPQFVRLADRMMRPSRWRRLAPPRLGI